MKLIPEKKSCKFKITKAVELIKRVETEPQPIFIWKGIPEGSKGILTGIGKTGKTTFAENLAISIAIGSKTFFGDSLCGDPRKVLFVNLEESYKLRTRRNIRQISKLTPEELELFYENYISIPDDFPEFLLSDNDWIDLAEYIESSEAEIVFIDSLSHMINGKIEDSTTVIEFVKKFRKHLAPLDKTYIIVHHNVKGNDKPIEQGNIAGSRLISQEFEYALGFSNIPSREGGNYLNVLFNKHIEKDDTTAFLYNIDEKGWVNYEGTENKYDLYNDYKKTDKRINTKNRDIIFEKIVSLSSQDSPNVTTAQLKEILVDSKVMSKDTLHSNLKALLSESKITSTGHGTYSVVKEEKVDNNSSSEE